MRASGGLTHGWLCHVFRDEIPFLLRTVACGFLRVRRAARIKGRGNLEWGSSNRGWTGGGEVGECSAGLAGFGSVGALGATGENVPPGRTATLGSANGDFDAGPVRTQPAGGGCPCGDQKVRDCQFKVSLLPWISSQAVQAPVVERCHFEQYFISESFLLKCRDCTFDGCMIGSPDSFAQAGSSS